MDDVRALIEEAVRDVRAEPDDLERTVRRARSRQRNGRTWAAVVALGLAVGGTWLVWRSFITPPETAPAAPASNGSIVLVGIEDIEPSSSPYGGPRSLWSIDPASGEASELAPPVEAAGLEAFAPRWTPDGSRVLWFTSDSHDGPGEIWSEVNGSLTKIVSCPGRGSCVWDPAWSPDGTQIAFAQGPSIMVVNADGTELRELAACPDCTGLESGPTWSPDGARLAFAASDSAYGGVLYVVNADGGGIRPIAKCESELCIGGDRNAKVSWSPTGDSLLFTRERNLWSVHEGGSGLTRLTSCEVTQRPTNCAPQSAEWSPDGSKIAYVHGDTRLTIVDASGDQLQEFALPAGFAYYLDAWQPIPEGGATPEPATVLVPEIVGLSEDEAASILEDLGLTVSVLTESSDEVAQGLVAAQDPSAGVSVDVGAAVTIRVSEGPGTRCIQAATSGDLDGDGTVDHAEFVEVVSVGVPCDRPGQVFQNLASQELVIRFGLGQTVELPFTDCQGGLCAYVFEAVDLDGDSRDELAVDVSSAAALGLVEFYRVDPDTIQPLVIAEPGDPPYMEPGPAILGGGFDSGLQSPVVCRMRDQGIRELVSIHAENVGDSLSGPWRVHTTTMVLEGERLVVTSTDDSESSFPGTSGVPSFSDTAPFDNGCP